jgi:arylsulfatase A-like enzyme
MSFLPLLKGEKKHERGPIYWHYPHYGGQGGTPAAAVRNGDYKLIYFFEDERSELYNLGKDIEENKNLETDLPEIAEEMKEDLLGWLAKIEAKIPQVNPDFKN